MNLFFIHLLSVLISVTETVLMLMFHMLKYAPNNVKNVNVKLFNLILGIVKTRFLVLH